MLFYGNNHNKTIDLTRTNIFIIFAITFLWLIYTWFFSDAAWLHPELLGTAAYIQNNPDETFFQTLRKIFDWKAFDPNVNRVRPLNDIFEVIDAMARPTLAKIFGPHPSAMPTALITAFLAPLYLFLWLRRIVKRPALATLLCAAFVSSVAFLSVIVGYIRPAKKLNLLFLCMSLYYAEEFKHKSQKKDFVIMYFTLLSSFFADEAGLANFVIIGGFYWQELFKSPRKAFSYWYYSLPLVFLILTKFALPAIYSHWSLHGRWDALSDASKVKVFKYLLEPNFYIIAGKELARSFLSMLSIPKHTAIFEIITLCALILLPSIHVIHNKLFSLSKLVNDKFIIVSIITVMVSIYLTLLDWYPFPFEVSYLGSFNYYYHSAMIIPCIMWMAVCADVFLPTLSKLSIYSSILTKVIFCVVCVTYISMNFILFKDVNKLVQIIHLYPYNNAQLWSALNKTSKIIATNSNDTAVKIIADAESEANLYLLKLFKVFGEQWDNNGFFSVMTMVSPAPIMTEQHMSHFFKSTLPRKNVKITFTKVNDLGWNDELDTYRSSKKA